MAEDFLIDINPNIEPKKYELILTKLNEEPLCELHNIEDLEIKVYFVNINEISFRVPFYRTENDGSQIKNELFDLVDGSMMVLVNSMKYFILTKPEIKTNEETGEIYKNILGFSREYELGQKVLKGYDAPSRKLYDYSNAKDSDTGLEIGFLNLIENTTSWKVGYINADLLLKYRHLSFPKSTYLQSFTEVQRTFGCIFKFDTINKIIDVYEVTQLGKSQGLYISNRNFINSLSQTINHDELKTRLFLYGNSNISIQSLNILGKPYIENYNFFKNTKFMSQGLIDALNSYEYYIQTKQGLFNGYLTQLNTKNSELGAKNDELVGLNTQLKVIQSNLDIAISGGQPTSTLKSQETNKLSEITTKLSQILTLQSAIELINTDINQISIDTDMTAHFTEVQARELDPFIREDEYSDSNYTEDNLQELLDEGKKILNKISYPNLTFNVDVEDFLSLVEGQHMWENFILGDFVTLEHEELGFDYEVRLVGYTHNPDNNKLNLTFSNRNSVDDPTIELKDLLEGLTTTSANVDFSRFKWDKGENANSMINNYINSNLDLEKQKIMGTSSQKPLVDERGIWLIKDVGGIIDPEQTRLVNNAIVMTKDGWNTSDIAISPNSGINANLINGKLGQFTTLNANQITVGDNGETIPDAALGGGLVKQNTSYNKVEINGTDGVVVKNASNAIMVQQGFIDSDGDGIKDAYGQRVNHDDGSFSAMVGKGYIRKWLHGESEYLNDLYVVTSIATDNTSSTPYPVEIILPQRFRNRTKVQVVLVPKGFSSGLVGWADIDGAYGILQYFDVVLDVNSIILNDVNPRLYVYAYLKQSTLQERYSWNPTIRYRDVTFDCIVIGY